MKYHRGLSQNRWNKFSIFEQMANIGSEVYRAISWQKKDRKLSQSAFGRALELFDITIADSKNKSRLKEICRLREAFIDFFLYDNIYKTSKKFWTDYFYAFNYAARLSH